MGHAAQQAKVLYVDADGFSADLQVVDALARLALLARRNGCELVLVGASAELIDLIELAGLSGVLRNELTRRSRPPRC
jgi:hypothetical protein